MKNRARISAWIAPVLRRALDGVGERAAQPLLRAGLLETGQRGDDVGGELVQVEPLGDREGVEADRLRVVVLPVAARMRAWTASTLARRPPASSGRRSTACCETSSGSSSGSVTNRASARAASIRDRAAGSASAGSMESCSASSFAARAGWPALVTALEAATASFEMSPL